MKGSECRSNVVSHFSTSRHSCSCILNSLLQFCLQFLMVSRGDNVIYFGDVSKVKKCYFTYLMRSLSNVIAKFLTWLLEFIGNESRYETTDDKYFFLFLYWAVETSVTSTNWCFQIELMELRKFYTDSVHQPTQKLSLQKRDTSR